MANTFKSIHMSIPDEDTTYTDILTAQEGKTTIVFAGTICNTSEDDIAKVTMTVGENYILKNMPLAFGATCVLNKMVIAPNDILEIKSAGAPVDVYLSLLEQDVVTDEEEPGGEENPPEGDE